MYIYIYAYMCVCIYIHIYAYIYTYVYMNRRRIADGASPTSTVPREHGRVLGRPAGSAGAVVEAAPLPRTRMQACRAHRPARALPGLKVVWV